MDYNGLALVRLVAAIDLAQSACEAALDEVATVRAITQEAFAAAENAAALTPWGGGTYRHADA